MKTSHESIQELWVTYRVDAAPSSIDSRVESLLLEQTVELPRDALHDRHAIERAVGRVVELSRVADAAYHVTIAQPAATLGRDPAQLMNVLFGNSSLQPDVRLEDFTLPEPLVAHFGGPRFGVSGLRRVAGVHRRALTCTALKPMGLAVDQLASLARSFARAGIDIIKDDHGLADQDFARFEPRVAACHAAVEGVAAATGRPSTYVPNLSGTPSTLRAQAEFARRVGVRAVMVSPMAIGLPAFHELVRDWLGVPVVAHPALGGAQRIAPVALLGRLFPLFGADAVIFPSFGGRFSYDRETCGELAEALRRPSTRLAPAIPVPAGGISIERLGEVLAFYGPDTVLLLGASLLKDPLRIEERSRRFVEQVAAAEVRS